ncbi:MAG: glutamate-1-semialdehyde 2,1-aminomutase [Planctomycetota bacterium]|nr:glutamate-1-semialdehyde 2,1-aminomutase [Planctomycetota bacterium]
MDSTAHNPPDARYRHSSKAFARARGLMPGGVSSPVRAYKSVGRDPIVIRRGKGARVTDIDGNDYIDYVLSYGPLILGHVPEPVQAALTKAVAHGTSFGMPTEAESVLAEMVREAVPSIQLVRFVNSGTEATMSAIRLARAATKRAKIIKFTGCYHGHSDSLLVEAGSGATTLGVPSSPGVPASITSNTLLAPYNDLAAVEQLMKTQGAEIAAILIEPIAGNMGCVPPKPGYLQGLRTLCDKHGVLLIFDEVMTGFRVAWGGAQSIYGVEPDLTCLGKVIGGGVPCAAYGGREDLMRQMAPDGPVYQAGTLSGNPLAMAAGMAMLEALRDGTAYAKLEKASADLESGLKRAADRAGVPLFATRVGSMYCPFFHPGPVENYEQALKSDTKAFTAFFGSMLDQGVVLPPSQYETWFLSTEHDANCIEQTITAAERAFVAAAKVAKKK